MQNDIGSNVANSLNTESQVMQLVQVIKGQADEIKKRGLRIVDLEDKNEMLQKNISLIVASNKQLESMIESLRLERVKLLEELESLKASPAQQTKAKKTKAKASNQKQQEAN
jgi:adenylosuccinate synthase